MRSLGVYVAYAKGVAYWLVMWTDRATVSDAEEMLASAGRTLRVKELDGPLEMNEVVLRKVRDTQGMESSLGAHFLKAMDAGRPVVMAYAGDPKDMTLKAIG